LAWICLLLLGNRVVLVALFLLAGTGGQGVLAQWFGLLQRLFIATIFLWIELIAIGFTRFLVASDR